MLSPWRAPTVTLKLLPDPIGEELRCLAYLLKASLSGKQLVWNPAARPTGHCLYDVSIRPDVALRLTTSRTPLRGWPRLGNALADL